MKINNLLCSLSIPLYSLIRVCLNPIPRLEPVCQLQLRFDLALLRISHLHSRMLTALRCAAEKRTASHQGDEGRAESHGSKSATSLHSRHDRPSLRLKKDMLDSFTTRDQQKLRACLLVNSPVLPGPCADC